MKKKYLQVLSLFLTVSMLAGCGGGARTLTFSNNLNGNGEVEETAETAEADTEEEASDSDYISYVEKLRSEYAVSHEEVEYTEPMYNVPENHTFVYENVCEEVFDDSVYETLRVFSDPELQKEVYTDIEEDWENGKIELKPGNIFALNEEGYVGDGTWGSRSKFYLAQYKDLETNETFEKPHVTVFTIKRELDTPTLEQSLTDLGYYQLTWNPVKNADYYEIYEYEEDSEFAILINTTEETSCRDGFSVYAETETETETEEDEEITCQNLGVLIDDAFIVVAKSEDGKVSGISNTCKVKDMAYMIPYHTYSEISDEEYEKEHICEGSTAMVLPTHMSITMLDESTTKVLLDYENVKIQDYGNCFEVYPKFVNLEMQPSSITFSGMELEAFKEDLKNVVERQKELEKKAARKTVDINIPYAPTSEDETEDDDTKSDDDNTKPDDDDETKDDDEIKDEDETKDDDETKDNDDEPKDDDDDNKTAYGSDVEDTVYANSALSAHIAINMLENEEEISLDNFPESSDRDFLMECILEAYNQNPLIGIMEDVSYDYDTNCLVVEYAMDKDESISKRDAAIEKAKEITDEIITHGMSDFEKEEAINQYLCENGSYDESIFDYIQDDGSVSDDVLDETVDSFLPYGILVNNVGVCESYAEAFLLLARNAGLDAVIETGRLDGIAHEWNRVKIDGQWYVMDVTNNDNDKAPNAYFNLSDDASDEFLIPDRQAISYDAYDEYTAVSEDKEFYLVKGRCADDKDEAVELMGNLLADEDQVTIRVNEELDESDVESLVRDVAENNSITDGKYYYYRGVLSMKRE